MAHDRVIDIGPSDYRKAGFVSAPDTTAAPIGALRVMRNAQITEAGGLAPRPGTRLLGTANASSERCVGLFNFKKSLGSEELLVKAYNSKLEYISKNYSDQGWQQLQDGYTLDAEFGFVTSLVNTDNTDYLIGGNRYEPYFTWTGAVAALSTTLAGGETTVTVDSTLLPDIYYTGTATANSATTLDVSGTPWAVSQWVSFWVRITSGAYSGKVRKISANTTSQITFDTLGAGPGNCTFEIRKTKFPDTGTLAYNGAEVAYTAIDTDATFTVSSASAAASGLPVTVIPTEYKDAPRGNRLANYLLRIFVGRVRSALTRDSGGALQGYGSAGSVFVSKIKTPTDFSFSATRSAGEGDVISMPLGGGDITDVIAQEDATYTFKPEYIEADQYSQDSNDLVVRTALKSGFGSIGKTCRGVNDIFFFTNDKQLTSLGRVKTKDIRPEALNIGLKIQTFLENSGIDGDVGRGMEIANKLYLPIKLLPTSEHNDVVLVFNRETGSFEGIWDIPAFGIERWDGKYYYAESNGPDVYELFVDHADVVGDTRFPIDFSVATHWINLTASKSYVQAMYGIVVEGWVAGGATFTTNVWSQFSNNPFLTFNFSFDESGFLDGSDSSAFLGSIPLSLAPLAAVYGDLASDGRRHFQFTVYFPFEYANYFSYGYSANEADNDFEITRTGLILKESPSLYANRVKII